MRAVFLTLRAWLGKQSGSWRGACWSAGIAAAALLLGNAVLPSSGAGWRLPLVWLVMPFSAWAAVTSFLFAGGRVVQGFLALTEAERRSRVYASLIWLAAGAAFFLWFRSSKDAIQVLKGGVSLTPTTALALGLAILASMAAMVAAGKSAMARGISKGAASHLSLLAGSVVFGLPFAWLVITSFKEDKDMSSANGLVWIPRVTQKAPYYDPDEVHVEGRYEGQLVEGIVMERRSDGTAKVEIQKPAVLRGLTFIAPKGYKPVPKMVEMVRGSLEGQAITGKVIKDLEDGRRRVVIMEPAALQGRTYEAKYEDVEAVRNVGLKTLNYPEALDYLPPETMKGLVYLKNTLIIVILSVIGTLLSSSIVAYAFARLRFPGKGPLFLLLLSTMMLPAAVTLIPTFLIFRSLGWVDTLRPLWAPAFLGSAFNIFLLRQFFMTIPMELEDAAKIDGCSYPRTFWQVMLPQVKPALAVVAIWTFMGAWNNFMGPLIYINSPENMPISYAVQLFQSDRLNEPGLMMAFTTMAIIPVLLVFFFAQKYFIEGVTLSGLGGR